MSSLERRLFIVPLAAAALIFSCARGEKWPALLHPVPPEAAQYALDRGAQLFLGPGFKVWVRPLDWKLVGRRYRAAAMPLPYGEDEAALSFFVFFSVRLENTSEEKLFFNPRRVSAFAGSVAPRAPLEISDIYRVNAGDADVEARARSFRDTSFDGNVTVDQGEAVEKYLVFLPPRGKFRTVEVVVDDLYLGSTAFDLTFAFEAFPGGAEDR